MRSWPHAKKVANLLVDRMLEGALSKKARADVAEFLVAGDGGPKAEQFQADADFRAQRVRETVGLLLSLPEYHTY